MATRPLTDPSASDSGIIILNDDPSQANATGGPAPAGSDSGIIAAVSVPAASDSGITIAPGGRDLAFRQDVAAKILDALTKSYVTRREFVLREAQRRGLTVEHLLAAYLTRKIMDKVDREYL
jgi:hypothetical protein